MRFDWITLKRRPTEVLPTAAEDHRGQMRVLSGDGATTADDLYFGRNNAGTLQWSKLTDQSGGASYTDEQAQDAVGNILVDSSSIDLTYSDATPSITAAAIFGTTSGTVAQGDHTHTVPVISGGVIFGGWISQNNYALYQMLAGAGVAASGNALTADEMVASLFAVPVSTTFDQITVSVTTAVAATTIRLGVYAVGTNGLPGALIADWGTVSSATTGQKTLSISWTPTAGWYYIVMSCSGAAAVSRFSGGMGAAPFGNVAGSVAITGVTDCIKASPGSAAALPNPFGVTPTATGTHRPTWLRVA